MGFSLENTKILVFIFPLVGEEGAKLLNGQGCFLLQRASHVSSPHQTIDGSKNTLSQSSYQLLLKWLLMDLSSCSRSNELCQWANTGEVWSPSSAATRVVGRTKLCCLQLDNDKRKLVGPKSRWQGKTWLFYTENFRLANTLIRRMLSNAQRKEYLFTEFFSSFCAEQ